MSKEKKQEQTENNQLHLKQIRNSPVWKQVEGLSVPTAVFSPQPDSKQDTYLDANTSDSFLARDFNPIEPSQITPTNSGSGTD